MTNPREVNAMLDLLPATVWNWDRDQPAKFLEPSCGTGNFLMAILRRKLQVVRGRRNKHHDRHYFQFHTLLAVTGLYGIDICPDNVRETRHRLATLVAEHCGYALGAEQTHPGFYNSVDRVLAGNIVCADTLRDTVGFTEYRRVTVDRDRYWLARTWHPAAVQPPPPTRGAVLDLYPGEPLTPVHYLAVAA